MKKFAYLFTTGSKIVWSGETEETLLRRVDEKERAEVEEFIRLSQPGDHIQLGPDMVFRTR